jgi:hypothetical protein
MKFLALADTQLTFEDLGMLVHLFASEERPSTEWLMALSPGGRDKVLGIQRSLSQKGYLKVTRSVGQPSTYWVRESLDSEFRAVPVEGNAKPLLNKGESKNSMEWLTEIDSGALHNAKEIQNDLVQKARSQVSQVLAAVEVVQGVLEEEEIAPKKGRTKKKTPLVEKGLTHEFFPTIVSAYKEMLRSLNPPKPGNFGDRNAAAREFGKLIPKIDGDPQIRVRMISCLTRYAVVCNGYPFSLAKFLANEFWEDETTDKKEGIVNWGDDDDQIDGETF